MDRLDRRLQLVIDEALYQRLHEQARRRGCSISALVRGAIDQSLSDDATTGAPMAAHLFLQLTEAPGDHARGRTPRTSDPTDPTGTPAAAGPEHAAAADDESTEEEGSTGEEGGRPWFWR